ncbi:MAG: helix-turn-helix domain-containing protein [Clostridia bacterium]|nr:helix-turn-helix domain-containing protein [Clostridia bacterium]
MDRQGFGGFITRARLKKAMSLRETAEKLGISPMYLSDVERGRRSAFTLNKLRSFASITGLTGEETAEMFDLAGQDRGEVSPDVSEYINGNSYICAALRTAKSLNADKDDWTKMLDELRQRKGK